MCWDAQAVMLLRCLRVAQGGAKARVEAQRMITEKAAALVEAQVAATAATLKRKKKHQVAKKALAFTRDGFVVTGAGSQSKGTGTVVPAFPI